MKAPTSYEAKKARIKKRAVKKGLNNGITLLTAYHDTKFQQGQSVKGDTVRRYGCIWIVMTHPLSNHQ